MCLHACHLSTYCSLAFQLQLDEVTKLNPAVFYSVSLQHNCLSNLLLAIGWMLVDFERSNFQKTEQHTNVAM